MTNRNHDDYSTVIGFIFLISPTSLAALPLARKVMPFPSPKTVYNHYKEHMKSTKACLSELENLGSQISTFIGMNN
jgi:hypothetical protein